MLLSGHILENNVLRYRANIPAIYPRLISYYHSFSNESQPFKFLVGAAFIGKPLEARVNLTKPKNAVSLVKFPGDSDIARWTSNMMRREGQSDLSDVGEDFFFVQTVMFCISNFATISLNDHYVDDSFLTINKDEKLATIIIQCLDIFYQASGSNIKCNKTSCYK